VDFPDDRLGILWAYERSVDVFKSQVNPSTLAHTAMLFSPSDLRASGVLPAIDFRKWTMYVMGPSHAKKQPGEGMYWTSIDAWPQPDPMTFYLDRQRTLNPQQPVSRNVTVDYIYNPATPTPTNGGNNLFLTCGVSRILRVVV
jgi:hypothetical protein